MATESIVDPLVLLDVGQDAWRLLDDLPAATVATPVWASVLASLLVLAVRSYDLDAVATVLRACATLGLAEEPIPARAAAYLRTQTRTE